MNEDNKVIHLSHYIKNNQEIETPNEIKVLGRPKSELQKRIFALGLDFMSILFINSSIHAAYALFVNQFLYPMNSQARNVLLGGSLPLQVGIFLFVFGAYFLFCGVVNEGKTIGKKLLKLSIINEAFVIDHLENTHHMSIKQAAQRTLGYLLSYLSFGAFFIFNFASEDQRGLSDYLSGTRTVSDEWLKMMLEHKEFASEELTIDIRSLDKAA